VIYCVEGSYASSTLDLVRYLRDVRSGTTVLVRQNVHPDWRVAPVSVLSKLPKPEVPGQRNQWLAHDGKKARLRRLKQQARQLVKAQKQVLPSENVDAPQT